MFFCLKRRKTDAESVGQEATTYMQLREETHAICSHAIVSVQPCPT